MEIVKQNEWFSKEQCKNNPNTLYIFGDNLLEQGTGGQAQIRYCDNSIGIPTKRFPTMDEESFFVDDQEPISAIDDAIAKILERIDINSYDKIVFPADGLGTGLAQFDIRCPDAFNYMNKKLNKIFKQKIYEEYE